MSRLPVLPALVLLIGGQACDDPPSQPRDVVLAVSVDLDGPPVGAVVFTVDTDGAEVRPRLVHASHQVRFAPAEDGRARIVVVADSIGDGPLVDLDIPAGASLSRLAPVIEQVAFRHNELADPLAFALTVRESE